LTTAGGLAAVLIGPLEEGSDGVVKYLSAHIDGVASEKIVRSGHSTQAIRKSFKKLNAF
jgi:hypothetical protein